MTQSAQEKIEQEFKSKMSNLLFQAYNQGLKREIELHKLGALIVKAEISNGEIDISEMANKFLQDIKALGFHVSKWLPIEEAPRDGSKVLLHTIEWDTPNTGWTFGKDDWQDCQKNSSPTNFMPLPPVPQGDDK